MVRNVRLEVAQPIVRPDGTMWQTFLLWALNVTNAIRFTGTGTPEGNQDAPQFSTYYDESGITGTIIYIKMKTDILGDRTKGWVLA